MRLASIAAVSVLLVTAGCGMATSVSTNRRVLRRFPEQTETTGDLGLSVEAQGTRARVTLARERLCMTRQRIEGEDDVTTTLTGEDARTAGTFAVGGLLSVLTGAALIASPLLSSSGSAVTDPDALTAGESVALGGGLIGLGALLAVPWIYTTARSGSSTVVRPFSDHEPGGSTTSCGRTASAGTVMLRVNGTVLARERSDAEGRVDLDLGALLPADVLRGPPGDPHVDLVVQESSQELRVDLAPFRHAVADADWARVADSDAPEDLERFVGEHPDDRHAGDARRRGEVLRQADGVLTRDAERAARWSAAGNDASRLAALVAEGVGDVWESEAACRAALQSTDVEALRAQLANCRERLAALPRRLGALHPETLAAARHELTEGEQRLGESEQAMRESAERVAEIREQALHRSRNAMRNALSDVRDILDGCRSGRATGPAAARAAYAALARVRANDGGSRVNRLVVRVAASCRCTPACAGVPAP